MFHKPRKTISALLKGGDVSPPSTQALGRPVGPRRTDLHQGRTGVACDQATPGLMGVVSHDRSVQAGSEGCGPWVVRNTYLKANTPCATWTTNSISGVARRRPRFRALLVRSCAQTEGVFQWNTPFGIGIAWRVSVGGQTSVPYQASRVLWPALPPSDACIASACADPCGR